MKLFLHHADVNLDSPDGHDLTPLSYAGISGAPGVVKLLSEAGSSNSKSFKTPIQLYVALLVIVSAAGVSLGFPSPLLTLFLFHLFFSYIFRAHRGS